MQYYYLNYRFCWNFPVDLIMSSMQKILVQGWIQDHILHIHPHCMQHLIFSQDPKNYNNWYKNGPQETDL